MFGLGKNLVGTLVSIFFLVAFIVSCARTSSSSGGSAAVQLKSLPDGVSSLGNGSQSDPFIILINENFSEDLFLNESSLALSDLFSNVESVVARTNADDQNVALLNAEEQTVTTKPGSKLSIELSGSNGEKKYADLYFQDAIRLTDAVQRGEVVLSDRSVIAGSSDTVTVTLYKKSDGSAGSVTPISLFDYGDGENFTVAAYEDTNGDGLFSEDETIRGAFTSYEVKTSNTDKVTTNRNGAPITPNIAIRLDFEPTNGDVRLHPGHSQILKIVRGENNKQMSSLAFKVDQWEELDQSSGESPTTAPLLELVWDETFDLLSYVGATEKLTVKLYKADNLDFTSPTGEPVAEGNDLTPSADNDNIDKFEITGKDDDNKYKFEITGESPSAIFEFSTASSDSIVGKKLYVEFSALKKESSFGLAPLPDNRTANGNGETDATPFAISGTFPANTAVDLTALVNKTVGKLTYTTVTAADDQSPGSITNPAAALSDQSGTSVVVRVDDSGSLKVKAKTIFLKLEFAQLDPS